MWDSNEVSAFFDAFIQHGQDWWQVARAVGSKKSAVDCQLLFEEHMSFLKLRNLADAADMMKAAFAAMVRDSQRKKVGGAAAASQNDDDNADDTDTISMDAVQASSMQSAGTTPVRTSRRKRTRTPAASSPMFTRRATAVASPSTFVSPTRRSTRKRQPREMYDMEFEDDDDASPRAVERTPPATRRRKMFRQPDAAADADDMDCHDAIADALLSLAGHRGRDVSAARGTCATDSHGSADMDEDGGEKEETSKSGAMPRMRAHTDSIAGVVVDMIAHRTPSVVPDAASEGDASRGMVWEPDEGTAVQAAVSQEEAEGAQPRSRKPLPECMPPSMALFKHLLVVPPSQTSSGGASTSYDSAPTCPPVQLRLQHALNFRLRRWCMYEFFCSAIDRPWYMQSAMQDALQQLRSKGAFPHVDLSRITRREWRVLRRAAFVAFGRPRRLSAKLLKEQRVMLELHREEVRQQYRDMQPNAELPLHCPRQLHVGQIVIARHPQTRMLHDGKVLTVTHNHYMVQFDRSELGVQRLKDIDVMPTDALDCLPPALLQDALQAMPNKTMASEQTSSPATPWWRRNVVGDAPVHHSPEAAMLVAAEEHNREEDVRVLAEVARLLDDKEALLAKLRGMNDDAAAARSPLHPGHHTPPHANPLFQSNYANLVLQIKDVNENLDTTMQQLQQRTQQRHRAAVLPGDAAAHVKTTPLAARMPHPAAQRSSPLPPFPPHRLAALANASTSSFAAIMTTEEVQFMQSILVSTQNEARQLIYRFRDELQQAHAVAAALQRKASSGSITTCSPETVQNKSVAPPDNVSVATAASAGANAVEADSGTKRQHVDQQQGSNACIAAAVIADNNAMTSPPAAADAMPTDNMHAPASTPASASPLPTVPSANADRNDAMDGTDKLLDIGADSGALVAARTAASMAPSMRVTPRDLRQLDRDGDQLTEKACSCVALLLAVQQCAERQLQPTFVARLLDNAVLRIRPKADSNIPLYEDILKSVQSLTTYLSQC